MNLASSRATRLVPRPAPALALACAFAFAGSLAAAGAIAGPRRDLDGRIFDVILVPEPIAIDPVHPVLPGLPELPFGANRYQDPPVREQPLPPWIEGAMLASTLIFRDGLFESTAHRELGCGPVPYSGDPARFHAEVPTSHRSTSETPLEGVAHWSGWIAGGRLHGQVSFRRDGYRAVGWSFLEVRMTSLYLRLGGQAGLSSSAAAVAAIVDGFLATLHRDPVFDPQDWTIDGSRRQAIRDGARRRSAGAGWWLSHPSWLQEPLTDFLAQVTGGPRMYSARHPPLTPIVTAGREEDTVPILDALADHVNRDRLRGLAGTFAGGERELLTVELLAVLDTVRRDLVGPTGVLSAARGRGPVPPPRVVY
jgi:hypothetical protein